LRKRRVLGEHIREIDDFILSPAQQVASLRDTHDHSSVMQDEIYLEYEGVDPMSEKDSYELGDSLLGPQDVAILLQSGLTSVMKSSTVVQLNQRMLLDLISSQPHSFAVAVLAEIGTPSGEGSPRSLTSALMSMLELDQTAFTDRSKIDMHALLESWLPGLKVPRRDDYMAGGRWARQSYYEAIFAVATSILEDAESYMALKGHLQRVRHNKEKDPIPGPIGDSGMGAGAVGDERSLTDDGQTKVYAEAVKDAKLKIKEADEHGYPLLDTLVDDTSDEKTTDARRYATVLYQEAFASCASLLELDRHSFQLQWFRDFYQRNYDALMVKSLFDNVMEDVDNVRRWMQALRNGPEGNSDESTFDHSTPNGMGREVEKEDLYDDNSSNSGEWETLDGPVAGDGFFLEPEFVGEQALVDGIIDAIIYNELDRKRLKDDPLVRLLIPNPPGYYNFAIVSAMGVITEGEKGLELKDAFERLQFERGVIAVRAGTATARSLEYNASKIEAAVEYVSKLKKPYGLLGYSQGCANALMAETLMNSGSPKQKIMLDNLVCRQLLFSAANGSVHGPATERKVQRLIVLCEEFFKYQQGYVSRALATAVIGVITNILDSSSFHKSMGGAQSFLPDGCRAFWREAQHLGHVPTCTLRGVLESHTTPESLEMIANALTKQSGSHLHDSQVHAYDAVGHPVYHRNRNGRILERCDVGEGALQRTHHWSPLSDEVEFVRTKKDAKHATFECAKDRHVFPWVEVNARFGIIKRMENQQKSSAGDGVRAKLGI